MKIKYFLTDFYVNAFWVITGPELNEAQYTKRKYC